MNIKLYRDDFCKGLKKFNKKPELCLILYAYKYESELNKGSAFIKTASHKNLFDFFGCEVVDSGCVAISRYRISNILECCQQDRENNPESEAQINIYTDDDFLQFDTETSGIFIPCLILE